MKVGSKGRLRKTNWCTYSSSKTNADPGRNSAVVDHLNKHLFYDGLKLEPAGRTMRLVQIVETAPVTGELSAMAARIDFDTASRDLDRALRAAADDPESP